MNQVINEIMQITVINELAHFVLFISESYRTSMLKCRGDERTASSCSSKDNESPLGVSVYLLWAMMVINNSERVTSLRDTIYVQLWNAGESV